MDKEMDFVHNVEAHPEEGSEDSLSRDEVV